MPDWVLLKSNQLRTQILNNIALQADVVRYPYTLGYVFGSTFECENTVAIGCLNENLLVTNLDPSVTLWTCDYGSGTDFVTDMKTCPNVKFSQNREWNCYCQTVPVGGCLLYPQDLTITSLTFDPAYLEIVEQDYKLLKDMDVEYVVQAKVKHIKWLVESDWTVKLKIPCLSGYKPMNPNGLIPFIYDFNEFDTSVTEPITKLLIFNNVPCDKPSIVVTYGAKIDAKEKNLEIDVSRAYFQNISTIYSYYSYGQKAIQGFSVHVRCNTMLIPVQENAMVFQLDLELEKLAFKDLQLAESFFLGRLSCLKIAYSLKQCIDESCATFHPTTNQARIITRDGNVILQGQASISGSDYFFLIATYTDVYGSLVSAIQRVTVTICGKEIIKPKQKEFNLLFGSGGVQTYEIKDWFSTDILGCSLEEIYFFTKVGMEEILPSKIQYSKSGNKLIVDLSRFKQEERLVMKATTKAYQVDQKLGFGFADLSIKFCTFEKVSTPKPLQNTYLFLKENITSPIVIEPNHFLSDIDYCPVMRYEAYSTNLETGLTLPVSWMKVIRNLIYLKTSENLISQILVSGFTDSNKTSSQTTLVKVCGWEKVLPVSAPPHQLFFDLYNSSTSFKARLDLESLFIVEPVGCSIAKYEIVTQIEAGEYAPFQPKQVVIDGQFLNVVQDFNGISNFELRFFIRATSIGASQGLKQIRISKCGSEVIVPVSDKPFQFSLLIGISPAITEYRSKFINGLFSFKKDMTAYCPIVSFDLTRDESLTTIMEKGRDKVLSFVKFDAKMIQLEVFNNAASEIELQFYIAATTLGMRTAYHKLVYKAQFLRVNRAPKFTTALVPIELVVTDREEQEKKEKFIYYTSPVAIDEDGDIFDMELKVSQTSCKCMVATLHKNKSFTLTIDQQMLTEADKGDHQVQVLMRDKKSINIDSLAIKISFVTMAPEFDQEEFMRLKALEEAMKNQDKSLAFWFDQITSDGFLTIRSSKHLKIPPQVMTFLNSTNSTGRRSLRFQETLATLFTLDLDVHNDDLGKIDYTMDLIDWKTDQILLHLNFTNPLQVSSGVLPDKVMFKINDFGMITADNGLKLDLLAQEIIDNLPMQLPPGVSRQDLMQQAENTQMALNSLIYLQLLAQVLLKSSLDQLWSLYFTMQLICYMKVYSTPPPPVTTDFFEEFIKLLEFQLLNLFALIRLFKPDFSLTPDVARNLRKKYPSFVDDMQSFVSIAILFVSMVIIMYLLMIILSRLRGYLEVKLGEIKRKMFMNGILRSIYIGYLKILVALGTKLILVHEGRVSESEITSQLLIGAFMIFVFLVVTLFLYSNSTLLRKKEMIDTPQHKAFMQKYSNLVSGIKIYGSPYSLYFYPIFMLRRLVYIAIAVLFRFFPYLQLQLIIFATQLNMYYFLSQKPFLLRTRHIQEVVNECFVMMGLYHLLIFSPFFFQNQMTKHQMGISYVVMVITLIAFNLSFLLKNIAARGLKVFELFKLKQEFNRIRLLLQNERNDKTTLEETDMGQYQVMTEQRNKLDEVVGNEKSHAIFTKKDAVTLKEIALKSKSRVSGFVKPQDKSQTVVTKKQPKQKPQKEIDQSKPVYIMNYNDPREETIVKAYTNAKIQKVFKNLSKTKLKKKKAAKKEWIT